MSHFLHPIAPFGTDSYEIPAFQRGLVVVNCFGPRSIISGGVNATFSYLHILCLAINWNSAYITTGVAMHPWYSFLQLLSGQVEVLNNCVLLLFRHIHHT
jgi:hypothetical protein